MGIVIENGVGNGDKLKIDSKNRAQTLAVTQTEAHHVSDDEAELYITNAVTTADALTLTATKGAILLIRNDSSTEELLIEKIVVSADAAGTILIIRKNDTIGTIADNNTETARNLNFASGNVADATIYSWNETNNGLGGLTAGQVLHHGYMDLGTTKLHIEGKWILAKDDNLVIATVLGTPEFTVTVEFYFEESAV